MQTITGGTAIVQMLRRHGVNTLFGLPGYQSDHLYNALYDAQGTPDQIRVINTRHEQGAAYMAYGYARATGGTGVCSVVPGPGMLNATAALSTAYATNARLLCLAGQNTVASIGRGMGMLHEIPDSLGTLRGLTKWAMRAEHPAQIPELVNEAFRQMNTGRPRPVALELPMDVLAMKAPVTLLDAPASYARQMPDPADIAAAVQLLSQAEHPLILLGGGAEHAASELQIVAEMLQAPVVANSSGKGTLSEKHYLSFNGPGGHKLWAQADVVLALGTRMIQPSRDWGMGGNLKTIRVDLDPVELRRMFSPTIGILADVRETLAALALALPSQNPVRASRLQELTTVKEQLDEELSATKPQYEFNAALRNALPDDGIFIEELTQVGYASRYMLPIYQPRGFIHSGYQGTLGYGFATALGVKVAFPAKAVLSINGDGGFMYNVQELATAVQHKIALVAVVFVDGAFGNVKRMQTIDHGGRVIASTLHNPDFVKLADSFGAHSVRVHTPSELSAAIRDGFTHEVPTIIEVPVGTMSDPWRHVLMPKVR